MQQKLVQNNFNVCAANYLHYAQIQKECAWQLAYRLPDYHQPGYILDLGSGPGTFFHVPQVNYSPVLYDLSIEMLKATNPINLGSSRVNGDANSLPFADNSFTTVVSNLMIQWCTNKHDVIDEVSRVLSQGGVFLFTTLIKPSLWQLSNAWQSLDKAAHTLDFLTEGEYISLISQSNLKLIYLQAWERKMHFPDILSLFQHFKQTGTNMPKSLRGSGLGHKNLLHDLAQAYPIEGSVKGYTLSYYFLFIIAKKETN